MDGWLNMVKAPNLNRSSCGIYQPSFGNSIPPFQLEHQFINPCLWLACEISMETSASVAPGETVHGCLNPSGTPQFRMFGLESVVPQRNGHVCGMPIFRHAQGW
jgi:hypothetical protein